jgi:hypothetical protein
MEEITNMSLGNRKRKSLSDSEGKENIRADLEIIGRPASFSFDLGINSAVKRGSPKLALKSPKVKCRLFCVGVLYLVCLFL